ncbi:MAG: GlsB/YeaQ/YmgE family stress response membrane protein [Bdellovibrionia bacterium]
MSQVIGYIIFGFIVGLIARALLPGRQHMGLAITSILGIVGSLLAGWLGRGLGWYGPDDGAGFIMSTAGAVLVLFLYHMIARRSLDKTSKDKDFPRRVA